jgi:hypothetical protein
MYVWHPCSREPKAGLHASWGLFRMSEDLSGYYNLHHLIYVSRATRAVFTDQSECVKHILAVATTNNLRKSVTGALLACDDWFVQILEGRRIDVGVIFEPISRDRDHCDISIIASGPATERRFASWSMCASTLSPTDKAIVEVLEASGKFDGSKLDAAAAMKLLLAVGRLQTTDRSASPRARIGPAR